MTDSLTIHITGLRCHGYHGVYPVERERGQLFVVDVTLEIGQSAAARTDLLGDTVDYAAVAARVAAIVEGPPVALLEHLASRIADDALADQRVLAAVVTVHKPEVGLPVEVAETAVTLRRSR